ncbi:hypothetical protein ACJIZ3_004336 [Penstemon smallii]|uniref:Uncharacterized protein n=1 Tax=Penstemon smallii TaxID=265156 RepID=A0ABD3S1T4_9LAMI
MANPQQTSIRPWFLELVPLIVVILIAAHVLALISNRKAASKNEKALDEGYSNLASCASSLGRKSQLSEMTRKDMRKFKDFLGARGRKTIQLGFVSFGTFAVEPHLYGTLMPRKSTLQMNKLIIVE